MVRSKQAILETNREVGRIFARAYRFLRAAKEIRDAWAAINAERLQTGLVNQMAAGLIGKYLGDRPVAARPGMARSLFASAVTPDGPVNYLPTIFGAARDLVLLKGQPGTGRSAILAKVAEAAIERGLAAERYYCGFDPLRIEHLYLPELALGFVTGNDYHPCDAERAASILDTEDCLTPTARRQTAVAVEADRELFADLIRRAVSCLNLAKRTHDRMEEHYVPNMDFAGVNGLRARTLRRILGYAEAMSPDPPGGCT